MEMIVRDDAGMGETEKWRNLELVCGDEQEEGDISRDSKNKMRKRNSRDKIVRF